MRVAALDIGTNSVLLLIAEQHHDGTVSAVQEHCTITRLGKGVDKTRTLHPAAVDRTLACLQQYASIIEALGVTDTIAVATSAVRDASGASSFLDAAQQILGVKPRVIDGTTEANLTFRGAVAGLGLTGPVCVVDIGGGSTEIVEGDASKGIPQDAISLDVGAVRMTERHLRDEPVPPEQVDMVRADVRRSLGTRGNPPAGTRCVGIAGTITTLCAMELEMATYDGRRIHGCSLARTSVKRWIDRLAELTIDRRRELPGLEANRADVILAGAVIVDEVLGWAGAGEMVVSDGGVRWGLALEWFGSR